MNKRTVILSEIIAPYRIPVFNALTQQEGIELHVIFLAETDPGLRQWRVYKDEVRFSYQVLPSWRWRTRKNSVLLNRGLWSALNEASPQVVISGGYNYPASWETLWWARRKRAKLVLWSESNQQDHRSGFVWVETLKRYFLRCCDAFVVPGKSSSRYLQNLGAAACNIFTAPNAVDNEFFAAAAETARMNATSYRHRLNLPERFILFAGRLIREKGVFDALEAYAKLEPSLRAKVGLVFAGDGVSREKLLDLSRQISPGVISFKGFAHREELATLYALAEFLVLPSHTETWGLVVNEAMVSGLPIIATSVAGCTRDLVADGWNGRVVAPHDVDQLSSAMTALLNEPEMRKCMALHSQERIQHYSPALCARGLAQAVMSFSTEHL